MILVKSAKELEAVKVIGDNFYLRKNITSQTVVEENGEERLEWVADEVRFNRNEISKSIDKVEVSNNFNIYYNWAMEKRENEKLLEEKKKVIDKMISKDDFGLADFKEIVDSLIIDSLGEV